MIATVLMMAVIVVIASVLFASVGGMTMPPGGHSCVGPQVRIESTDTGWYVEILTIGSRVLPEGVFLEVRTPEGEASLERTALSRLTPETGAVFVDANSDADEVRPGDGIHLDASRFVPGSQLAISVRSGMATVLVLS